MTAPMTMDAYVELRQARGGHARRNPDGSYHVTCPAHDDSSPSLHVSLGRDGTLVLHCFGCEMPTGDILDADDLTWPDLLGGEEWSARSDIRRSWDYRDIDGVLLVQIVDTPKGKRVRRPGGNEEWIWDAKGVPRTLYRRAEIEVARAEGLPVFFCEGESDADALVRAGEVATTAPFGAGGSWEITYSDTLRDLDVIVVRDRDEAGHKRGAVVVAALDGVAASTLLVEPREGKDARDHLQAGHSPWDFVAVKPEVAPATTEPAAGKFAIGDIDIASFRPTSWSWWHRLVHGTMNILYGKAGVGKGVAEAWITARLTRGELPGDLHGKPARVLWIGDEDDWEQEIGPRLYAAGADLSRVKRQYATNGLDLLKLNEQSHLRELERDLQGFEVVVFEALLDHLPPMGNPYDMVAIRAHLHGLRVILRRRVVTGLATMHEGRGQRVNAEDGPAGSHQYTALSRSNLLVAKHPQDSERRVLARPKGNYSAVPPAVGFRIASDVFELNGFTFDKPKAVDVEDDDSVSIDDLERSGERTHESPKRDEVAGRLLEVLRGEGAECGLPIGTSHLRTPRTLADLARTIGRNPKDGTVRDALEHLRELGLVERGHDKRWRLPAIADSNGAGPRNAIDGDWEEEE